MDEELKRIIINYYKSNDLIYDENKDIYSNLAAQVFNLPYEDCLEYKDNKPNIEGKRRRLLIKLAMAYLYCNEKNLINMEG